jgi:hypothetical protein
MHGNYLSRSAGEVARGAGEGNRSEAFMQLAFQIATVNPPALTLALSRKRERGSSGDLSDGNMLRCVFPPRRRWD